MTDTELLAAARALLAQDDGTCSQRNWIQAELKRLLENGREEATWRK